MAVFVDLTAGAAAGAAVLAITLAVLAARAWRVTGGRRHAFLAGAFGVSAVQAVVTAWLLFLAADLPATWFLVPLLHAITVALMYAALLRR